MLSTITGLKDDLAKLAGVLNQFKSETVQVKLLEQFFAIGPTPGSELVNPVATTKPRRGRPPKAQVGSVQSPSTPFRKKGKRSAIGATGALNALLGQGYFKSRRTIADITAACESKAGVTIKVTNLSGPLARFVEERRLQRAKNKDDKFEYWAK
ncbi:hypothetical protein DES53_107297 [Roseimicrobium gellanilyticum]|uniref:Uncharacterized protein n=1 Tax=Roseimicrobium gellanilyticum TaxID=748857 RepID=A0A366HI05_9BACT|nr:hypothetical protein [Roseimicrobium gellanilyticum]RBP41465.1 hypothetical protein DES53_107297 [Roseimicrobium gellanilyticum]